MSNRADNFNRANGTPLGTPSDGGSDWVADISGGGITFGINSNQAYDDFDAGGNIVSSLEASSAKVEVQVTLSTFGDQMGLSARVTDGSNYLYVRGFSGEGYVLRKTEAGSSSTIGTPYATTPADGDIIKLVCDGNNIEVFINGVSRITATEAFNNTATRHGLWAFNAYVTSARWDNFTITDLNVAATQPPIAAYCCNTNKLISVR